MSERALELSIKGVDSAARTVTVTASTDAIDSHGEVIDQASWQLDRYRRSGVVLWSHQSHELPVGSCESIGVEGGKLVAKLRLASQKANPRAEQIWQGVQEGTIRAVSVGFRPGSVRSERRGERSVDVLYGSELFEISFVPIGSNSEAVLQRAFGATHAPVQNSAGAGQELSDLVYGREVSEQMPTESVFAQRCDDRHRARLEILHRTQAARGAGGDASAEVCAHMDADLETRSAPAADTIPELGGSDDVVALMNGGEL